MDTEIYNFFQYIDGYVKNIFKLAKKKQFDPINQFLQKLTKDIISFRNHTPDSLLRNRICHDFLNKITSINIANEMKDTETIIKSIHVLECLNDLYSCIICNTQLNENTIPRMLSQYSIKIYKKDWFINEEISHSLIVSFLLQNINRVTMKLSSDGFTVEGIYKNYLEDPFFQEICDSLQEYNNLSVDFNSETKILNIKYNK